VKTAPVWRPSGDHEVDLVRFEPLPHLCAVCDLETHLGIGAVRTEARDSRRQDELACRGHRSQAHPRPCADTHGGHGRFIENALDEPSVVGEHCPCLCQAQPATGPGHQCHPKLALERPDRCQNGRLGDEQSLSSRLDGSAARQLEEGRELAESHKWRLMDSKKEFN
jgi:hypothetical protein